MDGIRVRHLPALAAALILLGWTARVEAYPSYDDGAGNGCVSCHPDYKNQGQLHTDHLVKFGITTCTACHQYTGGQVPVLTYWSKDGFGCSGCHGMDYGETSIDSHQPKATSYGLRRKHALEFAAMAQPDVCVTCHYPGSATTGEPDPAPDIFPETERPPYYGVLTTLTDPCSSEQESFESVPPGLDNDGNGVADMDDSACQAFVEPPPPPPPTAKRITVYPGQSIQDAVDAIAPGGTIYVMPGTYQEQHPGGNAVTISKNGIRLIARSNPKKGLKVILQPYGQQHNGIVVQPAGAGRIDGSKIKGFTIQGFPNNGILTRNLDNFRIERNESIDNLENGIWPTLSANGLVKKNVSYGSEDSALWIEASENVRVFANELHHSPTGLEITVSNNIVARKNDVHDNTTGIGLYHPSAAGLPPLQPLDRNGFWEIVDNHVHDNNMPNSAPPDTMAAGLPPGGGILVLGVDNVSVEDNLIENNDFYGITVVDYCLAVDGTANDCDQHPPQVTDTAPDNNVYVANNLVTNGTDPVPFGGLEAFAADISYLMLESGHPNCFARNTYSTFKAPFQKPTGFPTLVNTCP